MSRPAVLFGGPSPEHDISIILGLLATRALTEAGVEVEAIYWTKSGEFVGVDSTLEAKDFLEGVPRGARSLRLGSGGFEGEGGGGFGRKRAAVLDISAVLNCCHGGPGEDGTLQGALDLAGIRYTGPSVAGAALGMDKLAFGAACLAAGLPHLPVVALDPADPGPAPFDGPYIVKPRFGGSSIGIEVVTDWETALGLAGSSVHLRGGAVVEPYREDSIDVQVSIRAWPELACSPIEKPLRAAGGKGGILGYADKYVGGEGMASAPRELPAQLPREIEARIRESALALGPLVGLRGVSRLDYLWSESRGELFINEINTIPGSLSKYLWEAAEPAVPFNQLLSDLIAEATARPSVYWSTQGADGSALRSAGTIASKLG